MAFDILIINYDELNVTTFIGSYSFSIFKQVSYSVTYGCQFEY